MSEQGGSPRSRRSFLTRAFGAAAATVVGGYALIRGGDATAQKAPKNAVQYQAEPKGDQRCTNCQFWIPPEGDKTMGGCQVVAGKIHPTGWCNIWAQG